MYKILLLLLTITLCFSETILIPEDYATIQAADFNADGIVDILDIVQIVNYILRF